MDFVEIIMMIGFCSLVGFLLFTAFKDCIRSDKEKKKIKGDLKNGKDNLRN